MTNAVEGKLLYSVREAGEALGLSRSSVYAMMGDGTLDWTSFGAKRLLSGASIREFVERLLQGEPAAK